MHRRRASLRACLLQRLPDCSFVRPQPGFSILSPNNLSLCFRNPHQQRTQHLSTIACPIFILPSAQLIDAPSGPSRYSMRSKVAGQVRPATTHCPIRRARGPSRRQFYLESDPWSPSAGQPDTLLYHYGREPVHSVDPVVIYHRRCRLGKDCMLNHHTRLSVLEQVA